MPRDHRPGQPLTQPVTQPPALRVVPGELVASRLMDPLPGRRRGWRLRSARPRPSWGRITVWTLGLLVAGAALVGAVWLLVVAVLELVAAVTALIALAVAWVQAHWVWLVLAGGALLWLLARTASSASSCAGLHCGGCRR